MCVAKIVFLTDRWCRKLYMDIGPQWHFCVFHIKLCQTSCTITNMMVTILSEVLHILYLLEPCGLFSIFNRS